MKIKFFIFIKFGKEVEAKMRIKKNGEGEIPPVQRLIISYSRNKRPLPKKEEIELILKAKKDVKARNKVIESRMGLVNYVASMYKNYDVPLEDLIQEGNLALIEAFDKYNPERGAAFSTFAFYQIRRAIQTAICNYRNVVNLPSWCNQKSHEQYKRNTIPVSNHWISGDEIYEEEDSNKKDGGSRLIEVLATENFNEEEILKKIDIENYINKKDISDFEKQLLSLHLIEGLNYAQIGKVVGLSRERIRVILNKINNK